jgi:hypothetical protein
MNSSFIRVQLLWSWENRVGIVPIYVQSFQDCKMCFYLFHVPYT